MFNRYQYKSQAVFYNGNVFDSLLEFRYLKYDPCRILINPSISVR